MTVSIITVAFNAGRTVKRTIESVLSQMYHDIEYVFIDGASTDDTMDVVRSFGMRISKVVSEPDKGIYDAINKGISLSTGEIIGILNADDEFENESVVARVVSEFERARGDIVYGDIRIFDWDGKVPVRRWRAGSFSKQKVVRGWHPPHPGLFVSRRAYNKYGVYDAGFRVSADYELMVRYLYTRDLVPTYLPAYLVRMRSGGASGGGMSGIRKRFREDCVAAARHGLGPITVVMKVVRKIPQVALARR